MNARIVTQITVNSSPERVFKYLTDMKYHYLWNPQLQRLTPVTVLKAGLQYEAESLVLGVRIKANNTVTNFVKNRELEIDNQTGMVHYSANFKLSRRKESTLLICNTTVSTTSKAFAFAKPVMERLARRELQTDLQALKIAVEQGLS